MTRTLWLHCGSYKSGSSRIQNLAWTRRDELLAAGWLYPLSGLATDHPDIGVRHSRVVNLHGDPDAWRSVVEELVAEIDDSPATHVLMSSEAWSRPGRAEALADLLSALRGAGVVDDVQAVLYLRQRFDYARSLYREYTRRHSNALPLSEYVEAHARPLDLLEAVRTVRGAITPGDLQVFPYNEIPDTGAHFFGLLGLGVPRETTTRANLGIDAIEVEAHRQLNLLAPETRAEWPGLAAAIPEGLGLPLEGWTEQFAEGQLEADAAWRAAFAAETGWPTSTVDRLVERPAATGRDVTEIAGILRGVVQSWLDRACEPVLEMTMYPHPLVDDLVVDQPERLGGRFRLSGLLLARAEGRLLAMMGTDELEANHGRPSPGFARRHPDRPEAARARFAVPRCSFGSHGRIDLVFEHSSGERSLVATMWRRWRLAEGSLQA